MITGIINGPSRNLLKQSFDRHCSDARTMVCFVTEDNLKLVGSICSLTYEDGSGNSYCFEGYFNGGQHLKGWFHTKSRKGWIEVKPLDPLFTVKSRTDGRMIIKNRTDGK